MFKMRKWINMRKKQGDGHTDRKILELSTEEISIKATRIVKFFYSPTMLQSLFRLGPISTFLP